MVRRVSREITVALVLLVACPSGCVSSPPKAADPPVREPSGTLEPAPITFDSTAEHRSAPATATPRSSTASSLRLARPPALVLLGSRPLGAREDCKAETIRVSHILVAWGGAMRASAEEPVRSRTKDGALARIREALGRARGGADFSTLVAEYSDEPGSVPRGGDLGRFGKGRMVKPFEDAAFDLCPSEISDVVETPFGYHVILRTE